MRVVRIVSGRSALNNAHAMRPRGPYWSLKYARTVK